MNFPERKPNRLTDYDYSQNGTYFVTICTHNRAPLFEIDSPVGNDLCVVPDDLCVVPDDLCVCAEGNQIIHKWIRETESKFPNVVIDKYVIMPDHLHLLITIKERHAGRSLPDIIQFFKTMTTNEYIRGIKSNKLQPFDKKLWQKSYYDHVIRNQRDYDEIWQYIENNPQKWLLEKGETD